MCAIMFCDDAVYLIYVVFINTIAIHTNQSAPDGAAPDGAVNEYENHPMVVHPMVLYMKVKPTLSVVRPFRCCMYSLYHVIIVIPLTGFRSLDLGGECKRNGPSSNKCLTNVIYVGRPR